VSVLTIVSYDKVRGRNKAQRWLRSVCVRFFITNMTQPDTISQDTIMSYICTKPGNWAVVYLCVRGIDFSSFSAVSIGLRNISYSVTFSTFHFIIKLIMWIIKSYNILSGAFFNISDAITIGIFITWLTYFRCYILLVILIYFGIFFSILSLTCQSHSSIYSYHQDCICLSIVLTYISVIVVCVIAVYSSKINPIQWVRIPFMVRCTRYNIMW